MPIVENVAIKINGTDLSTEIMSNLIRVEVDSTFDMPDMCEVVIRDEQLSYLESSTFELGAPIQIDFKLDGSSSAFTTVMKGEIVGLEPDFADGYTAYLVVRGYDKTHRLNRTVYTRAFQNVTDSDLVNTIAGEAGLTASVTSTTLTREHVFQHGQTNLAFLQQLARLNGFEVYVDNQTLHFKAAKTTRGSTITLKWGEDLRSFRPRLSIAGQVNKVEVRGWNPKTKQKIVGIATPNSSVSVQPTVGFGGEGGSIAQSKLSDAVHIEVKRPILSQSEADTVAKAILREINGSFLVAEGICDGIPSLVSGSQVALQNLGSKFSGSYIVTSARHVYSPERYYTEFSVSGLRPQLVSEMLGGSSISTTNFERMYGVVPALVTNTNDPEDRGRVRVKYPWLDETVESFWARVAMVGSGNQRGFYWMPEVNDEVLVAFEHGDFNYPYVVGSLYNGTDAVPESAVHSGGKIEKRTLKTRAGHIVRFTDTSGSEQIEIIDAKNHTSITMIANDGKININASGSVGDVTITTAGKTVVNAQKNVEVTTQMSANITATQNIAIKATGSINIEATGSLTMKGATVMIEAVGTFTLKGTGPGTVQSSAILTLQGTLVKIN